MVIGVNSRLPLVKDLLKYADKRLLNNEFFGDWDIYDSKTNQKIVTFDSFLGYDYSDEVSVMNHPIESGSFASYNKVVDPATVSVILAKSGLPFEIRGMLEELEKYKDSVELVDVVTPYRTYQKYNLKSLHHAIRENGAINLLVVELVLLEVKEVELGYKTQSMPASKVSDGSFADTKDAGKKTTLQDSVMMKKSAGAEFADFLKDKYKGWKEGQIKK